MQGKFFDWLDHRTGYRKFMDAMLLEHIPGGAKWRYVWGSCLAFVFSIQVITGILLMTAYSPGDSTAWGSVYFIQYEMDFGWLIRGLHHFGSQTMVVLLGLHMLQVVIAGAHLPPREINWWLGLALMGIVLGLSLTGYLLPWDQKGYYATQVATNIAGQIPLIGGFIKQVLVGGPDFGHHTLTRFFTLHVGVLPPLLVVLLVAHIAVFRRHGVTAPANAKGEDYFWPAQAFRDMVVCLIVFGIMLALVIFGGHGNKIDPPAPVAGQQAAAEPGLLERWAKAGKNGLGANLDAPADRETAAYPARPEWYFLFLFQLLKYFPGDSILIGTVIIPNGVMVLLFLLPLFGHGKMRKFGHMFGIVVVVALLSTVGVLTLLAMADDSAEPWPLGLGGGTPEAKGFQHRLHDAEILAKRAVNLAAHGIPEEGARSLLRHDPMTKGPGLFQKNCASCHRFSAEKDRPHFEGFNDPKLTYQAADLSGYGSAEWVLGLLHAPGSDKYFGATRDEKKEPRLTGMIDWRQEIEDERAEWKKSDPEGAKKKIAAQDAEFELIARFLAQQKLPRAKRDKKVDEEGTKAFFASRSCSACHQAEGYFEEEGKRVYVARGGKTGPSLADYASPDWLRLMVMSPAHDTRYKSNNHMPAFRNLEGPGSEVLKSDFKKAYKTDPVHLSDIDREIIIRWMAKDYRVVVGGQPITGPPTK